MTWRSRTVIFGLACVVALVMSPERINWSGIRWGTAPEWVGALALLSIAAAAWTIARSRGQSARTVTPLPRPDHQLRR